MASAFVYIVYALDDASEVAEIADAVRDAGWSVCFGHLAAPGLDDHTSNAQRLSTAACVLAIWSANAANSPVLRSDALEAAQRQKLVLGTLDDAAVPKFDANKVPLQGWLDGVDPGALGSLISAIEAHEVPRRKGRGGLVSYPVRRKPPVSWPTVGAACFVATCLVMVPIVWFSGPKFPEPADQAGSSPTRASSTGEAQEEGLAAMARWAQVPQGDLPAIRGFIREHPGTRAAQEAKQQLKRLEEFAWMEVVQHNDLPTQLEALTNFRVDFPDGIYVTDAVALENQAWDALEHLRIDLISLGFLPLQVDADLISIRKGVEAFERSLGLTPSGRITAAVSSSLSVAVKNKNRRPLAKEPGRL